MSAPASDPRLGPVHWPLPSGASARTRARLMALLSGLLAVWYVSWLLQEERVGLPVLFAVLIAAESFNLFQAVGFWWTCSKQRLREHRPSIHPFPEVDVMIPCYDEPVEVIEPTVAAAVAMRGADARVWVLDDGTRDEVRAIAERHGAGYVTRAEHEGAKAGNINNALRRTSAPFVAVLDCDHVPHEDFLERTLGHLDDFGIAFVQTPQYYANGDAGPIAAAAAAQQNLFFGPIARGKDGLDAIFCCGTNVVFRRRALEEAGGFPEDSVTEDFELSIRLNEHGWRGAYVPEVLASGLGPEDMASYVSQQQRWARGCLSAIPAVLRSRLPWRLRLQYLLSSTYFLTGFTLLIYMSLPVIRILSGEQPLAASTADQFLLHFGPYYCAALATVAMAGYGTYTFNAFALAAGSFWIHVQAAINSLLRRPARFVVTPKEGTVERQPRAVAPALIAICVLAAVSVFGLAQGVSAATLNNVAFAGLHATVLSIAVVPALRLRSSEPLAPEPPAPGPAQRRSRSWPRPVAAAAIAAALLVPVAIAAVGSRGLSEHVTLSEKARGSAQHFLDRYVTEDGRVVRHDQGGDTVSEGQAYAMLLAVATGDRSRFESVFRWTEANLRRPDGLLAFRWSGGGVADEEPATDADLDAARALLLAGERFSSEEYRQRGIELGAAVLEHETTDFGAAPVLVAGPWARDPAVINPSYFSPRAYDELADAGDDPRWDDLAATSRELTASLSAGGTLPADWATVAPDRTPAPGDPLPLEVTPISDPGNPGGSASAPTSGLDAARVAVRFAEGCIEEDRRLAAALWPAYRRHPGVATYGLDGAPAQSDRHAVGFVAAAAAAHSAGEGESSAALLDQAQELDQRRPSYYGAAWVALGRVMLDSSALGRCPG